MMPLLNIKAVFPESQIKSQALITDSPKGGHVWFEKKKPSANGAQWLEVLEVW